MHPQFDSSIVYSSQYVFPYILDGNKLEVAGSQDDQVGRFSAHYVGNCFLCQLF
jgi:hypothetical protein